jgi:uncharacterized membrane protein
METLRRAFVGAAAAWSIGVTLAPVVASHPLSQVSRAGYAFALVVYAAGSVICHQRPERSFHLLGAQMPVCARCAGLYAGTAVAAIIVWLKQPLPVRFTSSAPRRILLACALPTAATLLYEWTTGQATGNWLRLASGAPLGAAVAWVLLRVN